MSHLSTLQSLYVTADIIEENQIDERTQITYIGIFERMKNENSETGCMIRRITETSEETKKTTKIEFAEGNSCEFLHNWNDRENLVYEYSKNK